MVHLYQLIDIVQDGGRFAEGQDKTGTPVVTEAASPCPTVSSNSLLL